MKRGLHALMMSLALFAALTLTAFADSGPKPQLVVKVEHAPKEGYYLDLLDAGDYPGSEYDTDEAGLDAALLAQFRAAIPEGWHGCISQGTTRAPIWGDLLGEAGENGTRLHTFRYVGVPEQYRILMVTASGQVFLSDVLERKTLQSSVTVDWTTKTVTAPLTSEGYLLQFAATLLPTLVIEFLVLLLFGFSAKENWKPFLLVNLVTQGLLHGYFALFAVNNGVSILYYLLFFPAEAIIAVVEGGIYTQALRGGSKRRAFWYGICANVCSAALGYFLAEPVWRFVVSIS